MREKKPKIAVLGLAGSSVFMTVDHFHRPGETLPAGSLYLEAGGKGMNQAVAAARLGADVSFYACLGKDEGAALCRAALNCEGIHPLIQEAEQPTAYACILTDRDGENQVTVFEGAAGAFSATFVRNNPEAIREADILLLNHECPREVNLAALAIAKEAGTKVILNPAPAKEQTIPFEDLYLITPNRHEAAALLKLPQDTPADQLLDAFEEAGFARALITLGGEGCALLHERRKCFFPAVPAVAVDTTGAGDCFNGCLASALAGGASLKEAVVRAQNAAALSVGKHYVMPSLPNQEQLEENFHAIQARDRF